MRSLSRRLPPFPEFEIPMTVPIVSSTDRVFDHRASEGSSAKCENEKSPRHLVISNQHSETTYEDDDGFEDDFSMQIYSEVHISL